MAEKLKQKEAAVIELAQNKGKLAELKKQLLRLSPDFLPADTLKESPQIEIIKKRIMNLDLQISQALTEFTEKHPRVISLKEQMDLARAELIREIKVFQKSAPQLIALQRQIAATEAYLDGVNADIEKFLINLGGIPDKLFRRETLGMELTVTQQIYRSLLDSLYEIRMGEVTTLGEIRIVEMATTPFSPISPNKAVNGILGLFLGFLFSLGFIFVLEYLDDTIRSAADLHVFKPVGLIGMIPRLPRETAPAILSKDPNDPLYESYRKVRNHLSAIDKPPRSLVVTSPGPGDGKTTTAMNLAICIARDGKRVVLIDMDLRRPELHTHFHMDNEIGIADVVQKNCTLAEALRKTPVEGLHMITCGTPCADPGKIIESKRIEKVLDVLTQRFDMVILDTAPALVKGDAVVLSRITDGSVVVVSCETSTRRAVHALLDMMAKARTKSSGIVLNGVSISRGKHYYQEFYLGHYDERVSWSES
jgi:capsular exopolysaccharide synthesis family protein